MSKTTITITSKGQFTLPAEFRRAMGLRKGGEKLAVSYSHTKQQLTISKPARFEEIQARTSKYIVPGRPPLDKPSEYYHLQRTAELRSEK